MHVRLFRNDKRTVYKKVEWNNEEVNRFMWESKKNNWRVMWVVEGLDWKWENEDVERSVKWSGKWDIWKIFKNHSAWR